MVNFRYHLVSLIAVFAALAIGVVLGAGPLQARLGSALSSSTGSASGEDLSAQLAAAQQDVAAQDKLVEDLAARVLPGTLEGVSVATVALPGADPADVTAVGKDLTQAGAQLVGAVTLTSNWDAQSMAQYRETLANPLASHLASSAPSDATADAVIGYALVEVLSSTGAEQDLVSDILTDASTPILQIDQDPEGRAQAVVAVGPRSDSASTPSGQSASPTSEEQSGGIAAPSVQAWAGLGRALGGAPKGGVLLGDASAPDSLLSQVRTQGVPVTTVDPVGTRMGSLCAVLALRNATAEERAFGVGEGASAVLPPIPGVD
ncbi:MAG: copper transporter [Actinomyces sp.]|nr:copper transporter [Actinomyces sp.]